jgi:uncharacterized protein YggE
MRFLSSALVLGLAASVARGQSPNATSRTPEIGVSAMGEAEVTPDRAHVSIGVQTQATTAAEAASRNATLQQAVINAVKALGIPAERITTQGYSVYPEQTYDQTTRRSRITGYNVTNSVVVDVWNVQQVGPVLDAALSKGANLVSSLSFYSSQAEVARRRALQNAVARARADAEAMAQAAGGKLGDLIELTTGVTYSPPPRPMVVSAMAAERVAAPTPISEGTQTVSAQVTARWRFLASSPQ